MAFIVKDRVQETCSAPGTGTVSLLGAVTGFQTFSSAIGNTNTTFYTIADQTGANWEVGLGTYSTTGNTLARTTVLASSNGGSLTNFASGTQNVWCDYAAGKAVLLDPAGKLNAGGQGYVDYASVTPAVAAGRMWYDGTTGAWNLGMGGGNITQQVGEELFVYGKASAAIVDSPLQIIYQTGVVGASGVITFAPTVAGITDGDLIVGVATESIALNGFGRVNAFGIVHGITTNGTAYGETWADGDTIWYNPVTGNPTKVKPVAPNIKVQIGVVINAGSGGSGSFSVEIAHGSVLGGTDANVQITSPTANQILVYNGSYWVNAVNTSGTTLNKTDFTATAAQTTFTVSYTVGLIEVYRNGSKLGIADYTATNGTSVVLASGCNAGDLVECVAFTPVNMAATIVTQDFSGNGSTTAFTMSQSPTSTASILVAISGVVQNPSNYTVSGTTLTFSTAPATGTNNISVRYLGVPSTTSVGSISFGSTGLTPSTSSTGAVTVGGVLLGAYGGTPAGAVDFFAMSSAPSGYIKANGAAVSRTTYATLFSAIGTTFGTGDGSTTFNVPDMRGYFPRGWVDNGTVDSGRTFGSTQTDAFQGHKHSMDYSGPFMTPFPSGGGMSSGGGAAFVNAACGNPSTDGTNGTPRTAAETRPSNVALLACIKY